MEIKIEITNMERHPGTGFVTAVHFACTVCAGEKKITLPGSSSFTLRENDFIPFKDLTKDIILGWIEKDINFSFLENEFQKSVDYVPVTGLPWSE